MEYRNRSQIFGLNLFACIAAVALACGVIGYAYFQFRAKEREAEMMKQSGEMMKEALKAQGDYWKNLEKLNQPSTSSPPAPPQSVEHPSQLPKYGTQGTP